jgi:hypothetical protein
MYLLVIARALVDESEIIRTQMGTQNRSEMVAVYGTHWANHPVTLAAYNCSVHQEKGVDPIN